MPKTMRMPDCKMGIAELQNKSKANVEEIVEPDLVSVLFTDISTSGDKIVLSAFRTWLASSSEAFKLLKHVCDASLRKRMQSTKQALMNEGSEHINFDDILAGKCIVKENEVTKLDALSQFMKVLSQREEWDIISPSLLDSLLLEIVLTDSSLSIFDAIAIFKNYGLATDFMKFLLNPEMADLSVMRAELGDMRAPYESKLLYHFCKLVEKRKWSNRPSHEREIFAMSRFAKLDSVDPQTFFDYLESFVSELNLDRNKCINSIKSEIGIDWCKSPTALCFCFRYQEILLDLNVSKLLGSFFNVLSKLDSKIIADVMFKIEATADTEISMNSITNFRDAIARAARIDSNNMSKRLSSLNWWFPFSYHGSFENAEFIVNVCKSESILLWSKSVLQTGGKIVELVPQSIALEIFAWMLTCLPPSTKESYDLSKKLAENLIGPEISPNNIRECCFLMPLKFYKVENKVLLNMLLDILCNNIMIKRVTSTFVKFCYIKLKRIQAYSFNIESDNRVQALFTKLFQQSYETTLYGMLLLELFLSKVYISDKVAKAALELISGIMLKRFTNPQLIFTCHLLLQFPKLSSKLNLAGLTHPYTCSLKFSDLILKRLIQTLQNQGLDLQNFSKISDKSVILATNRNWYQICCSLADDTLSLGGLNTMEVSSIDPEYLLIHLSNLLKDADSLDSAVKVEEFIVSGKLGFLIMCLSEYTPERLSAVAKFLIVKFSEKVELLQAPLKNVTQKCLKAMRSGLKTKSNGLPYLVAYFIAELFIFLTSSQTGYVSQAEVNKEDINWKSLKKKAKMEKMKNREAVSNAATTAEVLLQMFLPSNFELADWTVFPPKPFLDVILEAGKDKHKSIIKDWFIRVISEGAIGQSSYQILLKSGILYKFLVLAGSQLSPKKSTLAFVKIVSCLCKTRSSLKNAVDTVQIDMTLLALMQHSLMNNEKLRATVLELIEAFIFENNEYRPIEDSLSSTKSLIFLKAYLSALDIDKTGTVSDRNCATIITLILFVEDFSFADVENNCLSLFLDRLSQSDWRSNGSKLLFYLKWTLDMMVTSNIGLVTDEQRSFFSNYIKKLFKKFIF